MPEAARDTLRALLHAQEIINGCGPDPDEVMSVVVEQAQALTGADGAVVELAEGDEMVYRAVSGTASGTLGLRLPIMSSLSGLCVRTGEVLLCDDADHDDRVNAAACRKVGVRSMVVAPLFHDTEIVGALKVLSPVPHRFSDMAVEVLRMVAGFIAASLSRAGQFEATARQLKESERLNDALSQFSAHAAHDLKSPLATISMAAELLAHSKLSESRRAEMIGIIRSESQRSLELIDDLLRLARSSRTPQLETLTLGALVAEAAHGAEGLILTVDQPETTLVADRTGIEQALANLLGNARLYAAVDGAADVTVGCDEHHDRWRLWVADRGPGVPDDDCERLFSPLERGSHEVAGTGLGLAIVAAAAAAHGGTAGCHPRPGGGSVFWLDIARDLRDLGDASVTSEPVKVGAG